LIKKVPRFVEREQLGSVVAIAVHCVKKANWEIRGKGHKLLERCLDTFGVEKVTAAFPQGEEKLLRGVRKEFNRENRKREERGDREPKRKENKLELDERYDVEVRDLLDPGQTISRHPVEAPEEPPVLDERGRLVLVDAPKKKSRVVKEAEHSDDDDQPSIRGEGQTQPRQKPDRKLDRDGKRAKFVGGTAERMKAPQGRADQRKETKESKRPQDFAPLSPKLINKRFRGQMKAEYKRMFAAQRV
jgi:hypothetical protein